MTRKDYKLITEHLRNSPRTFNAAVEAIADALARDNPRFDYQRFYKAIYG